LFPGGMIALLLLPLNRSWRPGRRDSSCGPGFFFSRRVGNLVGIWIPNNPISGLTLATTIVAALTMIIVEPRAGGSRPRSWVSRPSAASPRRWRAMLPDLRWGTSWAHAVKMQVGDIIGRSSRPARPCSSRSTFPYLRLARNPLTAASAAQPPAPQAGLMAALSRDRGRRVAWPS